MVAECPDIKFTIKNINLQLAGDMTSLGALYSACRHICMHTHACIRNYMRAYSRAENATLVRCKRENLGLPARLGFGLAINVSQLCLACTPHSPSATIIALPPIRVSPRGRTESRPTRHKAYQRPCRCAAEQGYLMPDGVLTSRGGGYRWDDWGPRRGSHRKTNGSHHAKRVGSWLLVSLV